MGSLKVLLKDLNHCTQCEALFDFSSESAVILMAEHPRSEMLARKYSSCPKIESLGLTGMANWEDGGEEWAVLG